MLSIAVLGPVEARRDGQLVSVPAGKTSQLLVRLALDAGNLVRTDRLVEDLWGDDSVTTSRNTVQSKIAKLRRALGDPPVIVGGDGGYTLTIDPLQVDALEVLARATEATARFGDGDHDGVAAMCAMTLQMFRGDVLAAAGDSDWAIPHRARVDAARMQLIEVGCSARLQLGDTNDVIGDLEVAVATYPYQGSLWVLPLTTLASAGPQAAALVTDQRILQLLGDGPRLAPRPALSLPGQQVLIP